MNLSILVFEYVHRIYDNKKPEQSYVSLKIIGRKIVPF